VENWSFLIALPIFSRGYSCLEKKQIIHRLPTDFVLRILADFNADILDAAQAAHALGIGKTRLYELRSAWLSERNFFQPAPASRFTSKRISLISFLAPTRKPRVYRRFRRDKIGDLWQHDSSIHQWWPAPAKQVLSLTVDDHSGLNVAGRFVPSDTTWNHFSHFRAAFESHGIPQAIHTDGLSLFGPSSSNDHSDPKSEFQRALRALEIAHLVAPTPQAKGKIERRFGTFQRRIVTLMAHANVRDWHHADELLQMEITRQNQTKNRSTGLVPDTVWQQALLQKSGSLRDSPLPTLLDLHLSLRSSRRVNNDHAIDFEGRNYEIAPTKRKTVTIIHHPNRCFWVIEYPPTDLWPSVLAAFSL
jgi:hypothetical protein